MCAALQITKTFKGNELLKGVTWDVKKGQRVGLVGVNGAGKTTQLQIIMGNLDADSGEVLKARQNMNIAYLNQVCTLRLMLARTSFIVSTWQHSCNYVARLTYLAYVNQVCTCMLA